MHFKIIEEKTLYFFTAEFPHGKYGESFIENEIPILAKYFKKIILLPLSSQKSGRRLLPENATTIKALNNRLNFSSKKIFFSNFLLISSILIQEFIHCPNKFFYIKKIRHFNSLLIKAIYDSNFIIKSIDITKDNSIFYSFWMNDWALALSILKHKKLIDKFVFRCGGFDIYDERYEGNYLPFRYFIYKNASAILPNSKKGEKYIKNKNIFPEKVNVAYWGTNDHGINPWSQTDLFTLVSCSNVIPLKRIHLIIEILKNLNFKIRWIHFGNGESFDDIKALAANKLPSNVENVFKGNVSNSDVIQFYKSNCVNLFITTSETEGLPVSIQEAISFGIPIIATDVGGIAEIVNISTGILIEKNFEIKKISELIVQFKNGNKNSLPYREGVREFWKKNFEAEKNYTYFCQKLCAL